MGLWADYKEQDFKLILIYYYGFFWPCNTCVKNIYFQYGPFSLKLIFNIQFSMSDDEFEHSLGSYGVALYEQNQRGEDVQGMQIQQKVMYVLRKLN